MAAIPLTSASSGPNITFYDGAYQNGPQLTPDTLQNVLSKYQTITASEGGSRSETLNGMIQSDAVISQGDSGGPLANTAGQVVGMKRIS